MDYFEAVDEAGGAFIMRLTRSHDPWVRAAWIELLAGGGVGMARVRGGLVLAAGASLFGGSVDGEDQGRTFGGGLSGRAGWRPWIGRATLEVFAGLELRAARHALRRDGASGATQDVLQVGGGPQLGARVYVDLGGHTALFIEAAGGVLVQRQLERAGLGWIVAAAGGVQLGAAYAF